MTPIGLTPGVAPDVTIIDRLIYVAYGAETPDRLELVVLNVLGEIVRRETLDGAGFASFPRFGAPWLAFKDEAGNAVAVHVLSGQAWDYGAAAATFGLAVNPAVGVAAFEQLRPDGWRVCFGSLENGQWGVTPLPGAPDGIDQILSATDVSLRKDTRTSVPRMLYPVRAGDLVVGEHADEEGVERGGVAVRLAGDVLRVINLGSITPDPRCATDGTLYAIVWWQPGGDVQLWLGSRADIQGLPRMPPLPDRREDQPNPKPPQPKPEPILMQPKPLPDDVHVIVVALYLANKELAHGSDDDRRALQKKICETVRARKGDRWGWKSNHGIGIANAKDAIAELPAGATFTPNQRQPLYIWDLFSGGTRAPNPQPVMSEATDVEQFFVPVEPVDHLGGSQPAPSDPPPVGDLEARVARIERWIGRPL